jgi:hypothetical protein
MPRVGFESTIPALERAKTVHAAWPLWSAFYDIRNRILNTAITDARHWTRSWGSSSHLPSLQPFLHTYSTAVLPSCSKRFPTIIPYSFIISSIRATCPSHHTLHWFHYPENNTHMYPVNIKKILALWNPELSSLSFGRRMDSFPGFRSLWSGSITGHVTDLFAVRCTSSAQKLRFAVLLFSRSNDSRRVSSGVSRYDLACYQGKQKFVCSPNAAYWRRYGHPWSNEGRFAGWRKFGFEALSDSFLLN